MIQRPFPPINNTNKPLRVFILDDEIYKHPRNAIMRIMIRHATTVATSVAQGKERYINYTPNYYDLLLLDHDMHGFYEPSTVDNCGYKFAEWLVDLKIERKPIVFLHSQNTEGRNNMQDLLSKNGFITSAYPFSQKYLEYLESSINGVASGGVHHL